MHLLKNGSKGQKGKVGPPGQMVSTVIFQTTHFLMNFLLLHFETEANDHMAKIVCHCFLVCIIQNGTVNVTGPPGQKGEKGIQGITGAKGESGLNGTKGQVHHSLLLTPSFCGVIIYVLCM